MTPPRFRLLLFILLIVFLPMFVLLGFAPTALILLSAITWSLQGIGLATAIAWIAAGIGVWLSAIIARALTRLVFERQDPWRQILATLALLAPPIAGALPIYGFAGHGEIHWSHIYVSYASLVKDAIGRDR